MTDSEIQAFKDDLRRPTESILETLQRHGVNSLTVVSDVHELADLLDNEQDPYCYPLEQSGKDVLVIVMEENGEGGGNHGC